MIACIDSLSQKHLETKYVRNESTQCIENWPDANVPCLFVYHSGDMQTQLVGLGHVGGFDRLDVDVLEWSLSTTGAIKTDKPAPPARKQFKMERRRAHYEEDEDDDDDYF